MEFNINCVVGSAVDEPLTTANPINTPRQHNRQCICKGESIFINKQNTHLISISSVYM